MVLQPFSQVPFLPLIRNEPTNADQQLLVAAARVVPFLIPTSLFDRVKAVLPQNAEYYLLQDEDGLTVERACDLLDAGASKLVTRDLALLGQLPPNRLLLQIDPSTATPLADINVVSLISGILLKTPTLAENLLKSFRAALAVAPGRQRDIFVMSASDDDTDTVLHLPSSLKLMSKTVTGSPVIPLSALSNELDASPAPRPINGRLGITNLFISAIKTDRDDMLIPTIPVSLLSVPNSLGLVYSSRESIANSIISGNAVYYSRSRHGLWRKGETSGALQKVERIRYDCDADAIEFQVLETGPNGEKDGFCHVPDQQSCFGPSAGLVELEATLRSRRANAPSGSYTARLFSEPKLLQAKIMEEAKELCEATSQDDVAAEAADLIYFALTKCVGAGVGLREIGQVLAKRSLKVTRRSGDAKKEWAEKLGLSDAQAKGVNGSSPALPRTEASKAETTVSNGNEPTEDLKCQVYDGAGLSPSKRASLLKRPLVASADMQARIAPIMSTVRTEGDKGLRGLVAKFDRCAAAEDSAFSVTLNAPFPKELMQIDPKVKAAIDQAYANIKTFHGAQMEKETKSLEVETMPGIVCSRFARPIEKVGLYVPGGTAILPSTAIMLATPAQIAQCSHVTIATPPRPDGSISPEIVYIASLTNVKTIVKAGGAHAVAAMAYGTESIPKVDKIFGPGNQFVTAAKMAVSTDSTVGCAIDMPAGPSEVLVIADKTCKPDFVASDLLSQAEHGADSQVVLLTIDLPDAQLAEIERQIKEQALALPRVDIMRKSIAHSIIIKCATVDEAFDVSNEYAPEHLILHLDNASSTLPKVKHAGSVFVGAYSPESCGDYASGTNHSLPTYGYARQYSGVSTSAFLKHITSQELTQDGLRLLGPTVETLAAAEGLDAHRMAVTIRLRDLSSSK